MRMYRNKSQLLMIVLVVGFFAGIVYQNIVSGGNVLVSELFLKSNLQRYLQTDIIAEKYLWYVVKARVLLLAIVCFFSCIKWKKLFVMICLAICGFFAGILTVSAVLQLGAKGILICIAGMFPQGIFYGMAYSMLFVYWFRYPEREWNRTKMLFVIVMFLTGILVETYVNPIVLKGIIRII